MVLTDLCQDEEDAAEAYIEYVLDCEGDMEYFDEPIHIFNSEYVYVGTFTGVADYDKIYYTHRCEESSNLKTIHKILTGGKRNQDSP